MSCYFNKRYQYVFLNPVIYNEFEQIWNHIRSGDALKDPQLLNTFTLLCFSDLKKYKFYYWLCVPAILPLEPFLLKSKKELDSDLLNAPSLLGMQSPFFLLKRESNQVVVANPVDFLDFFSEIPSNERIIGFIDPSELPDHPGWPLRNYLLVLQYHFQIHSIHVLCLRRMSTSQPDISSSFLLEIELPPVQWNPDHPIKSVGWERNILGKLGPRLADLAATMDPVRLAETAVDLNLKLMRWRAMPSIPLEDISNMKCLLFGAGTLGCYVARTLLAWGIRNITFVDSGKVSFSNPVRQPLFTFQDCLQGGKPKAKCAAEHLKEIFQGGNRLTNFQTFAGHPMNQNEETLAVFKQIEDLISKHDVIFLLTDSRESRWLPTLLGAAQNKVNWISI